jgi:hypothetical protein
MSRLTFDCFINLNCSESNAEDWWALTWVIFVGDSFIWRVKVYLWWITLYLTPEKKAFECLRKHNSDNHECQSKLVSQATMLRFPLDHFAKHYCGIDNDAEVVSGKWTATQKMIARFLPSREVNVTGGQTVLYWFSASEDTDVFDAKYCLSARNVLGKVIYWYDSLCVHELGIKHPCSYPVSIGIISSKDDIDRTSNYLTADAIRETREVR